MKKKTILIVVVVLVIGALVWLIRTPGRPGRLDSFATCIKDSGAMFYGAFWCPHCQNQKGMFGSSARLLPYVECSTPDGNGQLAVCAEAGVTGYPTWKFPDGRIETGEISLEKLSEITSCPMPKQDE